MVEFSSLTHLHFGAPELDKQTGDNNYNGVSYYTCKCGCKIVLTRTQTKRNITFYYLVLVLAMNTYI